MTPDLPPALRGAIDRALDGVSRGQLAQRTARTSAAYRAGGTSAAVIREPADALAYALVRMPATYAACATVFAELERAAPGFRPARLLDAGCGPGAASWAAAQTWPQLSAFRWLDASTPFLQLAGRLAEHGPAALQAVDARRLDLTAGEPWPRADLAVASYALAEIAPEQQSGVIARLWDACDGVLALVEPGTPAGYARILAARSQLIAAGAAILAPCPHAAACPLTGSDWCHFSVRLPRSRDHRLAKGAEVSFEDERFAYLLAGRPQVAQAATAGRILAPPKAGKPGIELKVCGPDGLERRFVARRDKAAHAVARRLDWGDAWPSDAPTAAGRRA